MRSKKNPSPPAYPSSSSDPSPEPVHSLTDEDAELKQLKADVDEILKRKPRYWGSIGQKLDWMFIFGTGGIGERPDYIKRLRRWDDTDK